MNNKQLFKDYLQTSGQQIDVLLTKYLADYGTFVHAKSRQLVPLYEKFVQSISGGKMLRGTLVHLGYSMTGKELHTKISSIAAAFEILHTSLLIHDDIIDKSPIRRGKASLYAALGGDHYSISQAICLGDLGFFLAMKLLNESEFPLDIKNKMQSIFTEIEANTVLGEMLDVALSNAEKHPQTKDIITMYLLKTAHYTIVGPLMIGAIAAGAKKELTDTIEKFGENLGIAFQLQDDLLGIFGSEKTIGKSIYSDIEEGKQTLLLQYTLKNASAAQLKFIESHYGNGKINKVTHRDLLTIFEKTGAKKYVELEIKNYSNIALKSIEKISVNAHVSALLQGCVALLLNRTK